MPGMTGIDLAGRLGEIYPDLKVLFMSGYADEDLESRGLAAPGAGSTALGQRVYLQKPFSLREFVPKVRALLEGTPDPTGA